MGGVGLSRQGFDDGTGGIGAAAVALNDNVAGDSIGVDEIFHDADIVVNIVVGELIIALGIAGAILEVDRDAALVPP